MRYTKVIGVTYEQLFADIRRIRTVKSFRPLLDTGTVPDSSFSRVRGTL